ncbi:MAG: tetratricopeptide repeat protein [Rhodobacteraceae bacterium]|nr:tetratricopeptide repeat protein [Paracoccaceae bacterium]
MKLLTTLCFVVFLLAAEFAKADKEQHCLDTNPNEKPRVAVAACTEFLNSQIGTKVQKSNALLVRGVGHRVLGELSESLDDIQKASKLHESPGTLRMLAWTYREMKEYARAEEIYTQVLLDDDHWQGWLSRCVVRHDLDKYTLAVSDCENAIRRDPENTDALYFLASAYNFLNDGQKAKPIASRLVELEPDTPRGYIELAWALYLSGHKEEATGLARGSLLRFPEDPDLLHFLKVVR